MVKLPRRLVETSKCDRGGGRGARQLCVRRTAVNCSVHIYIFIIIDYCYRVFKLGWGGGGRGYRAVPIFSKEKQ